MTTKAVGRTHRTLAHRQLPLVLLAALLGVAATGCSGRGNETAVTFVAEPAGHLRLERLGSSNAQRGQLVAQGPSPLRTRVDLRSGASYRLTAEPRSAEAREVYETTQVTYDREALLRAAGVSGRAQPADGRAEGPVEPATPPSGPLRVTVPLAVRPSSPMAAVLPVYDPRHGWLAVRTRLRSYRSLVEADGRAPEQVAPLSALSAVGLPERLGREAGVWGLDISAADGGRVVTSVFRPAGEGLQLDREDAESAGVLARLSPDARKRAPARFHSEYRFPITSADLVSLRLTGLTEVRLTTDGHADLTPAFSPDGEHVFFASNRDEPAGSDIFRRPALRSGALDVVTRNLPAGGAAWPSQAADGTVAFGFFPAGAMSPDSGQVYAKIGGLGGYDSLIVQGGSDPRISPDGQQIAYIARGDLWVCTVDGAQQRRITTDGAALLRRFEERSLASEADRRRFKEFEAQWLFWPYRDPAWSPDGRFLAFSALSGSDPEGRPNYDIWLLEVNTNRQVQITTNGSADLLPRFDPAGRQIYFLSNRNLQWSIWRLPVPESELSPP